jgi:acyl carrier protein
VSATLEDRVKTAVIEMFLGGDVSFPLEPDTNMIASGICDSLGLVRLAADLEARFPGLRIQDQDITHENMGTVAAIAAFIRHSGVDS